MGQKKKILCVGPDAAVDKTIQIENFDAGQKYRPREVLTLASGKGCNCARVLKTLGESPAVLAWAGGHNGRFIENGMRDLDIETHFIPIAGESRVCVAVLDPLNRTLTEINETNPPVSAVEVEHFLHVYLYLLPTFDLVTFSGRLPPGVPVDFYAVLIDAARQAGKLTLLDTYGVWLREALQARPALVKPNLAEFCELVGEQLTQPADIARAAVHLSAQVGSRVVVTLGANGALACSQKACFTAQPPPVDALNPIGSGDAFLAGMASTLLAGGGFEQAVRLGTAAAAANTLQLGAGILRFEDVQALLEKIEIRPL